MRMIRELYSYREMIISLVRKDLRGRYKGSILGFLWTFINPLLQLIIYTIVFSFILKGGIDKFYLFLFVALVPWIFFSSAVTGGATSIISQQDMVKKIYFPRQVLPIAYVTSSFFNMLFSFIIIFLVICFSSTGFNIIALLFLPIVMTIEYILALGIAMLSSSLTVFFRDLEHVLNIITMAWMYLTPIMYPIDIIPNEYLKVFYLNPMTPIIIAFRDILYYKRIPQFNTLFQGLILGLLILLVAILVFNRLQKKFAEEL